ncbi:sigma-70 family RNA polymerase sigma factor [Natranaerofaba carboxydovora]|uniref:sigma-70 family RNA polymerase sigma factor n=1 Tax=Natranaerofaba carboxydovora TaxID=2742683 RepID=UPI001F14959C|nr:sigma-70 family RNA polymerase sigma factor [Natranaerofaba carboxydovora]UMZ72866.1 RNA polymerase sigma factor SigV [Natranaerofaba carboxydovora]UMZ74219.1 RNA polymerase sigma factor SigV [Natranaerofaba carboxydovora]
MTTEIQVQKAVKGDEDSFVNLIQSRKEKIYRIAFSYVKNKEDALDVVQEATYKAYISLDKLKQPEYFDTWLVKITINTAVNYIKSNKKYVFMENKEVRDSRHNKDEIVEMIDLNNALDDLEQKDKEIIILKSFEGFKLKEISEILGYPLNTVKTKFYRGLKKIKDNLEGGYNCEG